MQTAYRAAIDTKKGDATASPFFGNDAKRKRRGELKNSPRHSYPKPGSNRHSPFGPRDFKSLVSTYSTIRAPLLTQ